MEEGFVYKTQNQQKTAYIVMETSECEKKPEAAAVTSEPVAPKKKWYSAALVVTAALLPGLAAFSTVIVFLVPNSLPGKQTCAPFWGSAIALLGWLFLTLFCRRFTNATFAIPSSYGELRNRLAQLECNMNNLCQGEVFLDDHSKKAACEQIREQIKLIKEELGGSGLSWALARGYINVWKRLHRAEEAMIEIEPQESVIAGALTDMSRLQGSKIDNRGELAGRILQAVNDIAPSAVNYFQGPSVANAQLAIVSDSVLGDCYEMESYSQRLLASGGTPPVHWSLSQGSKLPDGLTLGVDGVLSGTPEKATAGTTGFHVRATDSTSVSVTKAFSLTIKVSKSQASQLAAATGADRSIPGTDLTRQARAILRNVRNAINDFRDGRWNSIIVARNRLVATMMLTALTAYLLLAIAIIMGASRQAIAAASAFYLVGATIGLLNQLRSASQNDSAVEDYGLSTARLITMPLFSGLAAIGGVFLVTLPQLTGSYLTNTAPLTMVTPSILQAAIPGQMYHRKMEATGGTPPYQWYANQGQVPEWIQLKASGDLLATVPKETGLARSIEFTASVMDSTGTTVEKSFNLDVALETSGTSSDTASQIESPPTFFHGRLLEDIFDVHKNIGGLILAAVFGLTPGLLFDRLQQKYENYKADLKGSEATSK